MKMLKAVSFNLVDEPWMIVRGLDGATEELSLSNVFERARELASLANDTPTQDFAILRVLLAVVQRAVLTSSDDCDDPLALWEELWQTRSLPIEEIRTYLSEWRNRFDLFDDEAPFMQVANLEASNGSVSEIRKLIADVPDGKALFSLRSGSGLDDMAFGEAARWLVHVHAFDTAGIKTGVKGDSDAKNGKSYPIGTGWAGRLGGIYLEGHTFSETLLLNLVLCDNVYDVDSAELITEDDMPVWERAPQKPGNSGRFPSGPSDFYTWQSRRVRLIADGGKVTSVVLSNGDKVDTHNQYLLEPMSSWRRSPNQEKKLGIHPVLFPATHKSDRALWRGLTSLLPQVADGEDFLAPGVIMWAQALSSDDMGSPSVSDGYEVRIHGTGVEYGVQSSVITEMTDDAMLVSMFLLSRQGELARFEAKECMEQTERAVRELGRLARRLSLACGDDPERTGSAQVRAVSEAYFELDDAFRSWLSGLGAKSDLRAEKNRWYETARSIIGGLGCRMVEACGSSAIVGRKAKVFGREEWVSAGKAESQFRYWLYRLLPQEDEASKQDEEGA